MSNSALPNESQRQQLCELMHFAFLELRSVNDQSEQVYDLAYAFHNLPLTMYGWGTWSVEGQRAQFARYRERYPDGPDYPSLFDAIFHPT